MFSNPVATSDERRVSDVWGSLLVAAAPFPEALSPAVTVLVAYAKIVTNRDPAKEMPVLTAATLVELATIAVVPRLLLRGEAEAPKARAMTRREEESIMMD